MRDARAARRTVSWTDFDAFDTKQLTVYPRADLRHRPRSSTDGKPIERLSLAAVLSLIRREHPNLAAQLDQDDHYVHF
jgi:hypothetical protein